MQKILEGNTLILCATDAGGARNLVPLIKISQAKGLRCIAVASKITLPIFNTQNVEIENPVILDTEDATQYLTLKKPLAVICGTTRYPTVDRFLTVAARYLSIRSLVVLDEWFNYRLRFKDEKDNLVYLPDVICCQDEQAKKEAVKEGISSSILRITGSPSLSEVSDKAEQFILEKPKAPDFIKPYVGVPAITFLSETHEADHSGTCKKAPSLGYSLGYTEVNVKEKIINVIKRLNHQIVFAEKLHPSAKESNLGIQKDGKITLAKVKNTDLWPLLWHSNCVIGMKSMALLESAILGRPTVSFQPGLTGPQLCTAVRLGLVDFLSTPHQLENWCRSQLDTNAANDEKKSVKRHPFARKDAAENVLRLALGGTIESQRDHSSPYKLDKVAR